MMGNVRRPIAALLGLLLLGAPIPAEAQGCRLDFTVEITQGVGSIRPGTLLEGVAEYTIRGEPIRQEGGSTAHLATGRMELDGEIHGPVWTLIITSRGATADLVGIYAHNVEGLTVAGIRYEGPMALTLFGRPGDRPHDTPPLAQEDFDRLDLRRAFTLHAHGRDMLSGDVVALTALCS